MPDEQRDMLRNSVLSLYIDRYGWEVLLGLLIERVPPDQRDDLVRRVLMTITAIEQIESGQTVT